LCYSAGRTSSSEKPLHFVGSAREDLRAFPLEARQAIGHALFAAQVGSKHPSAKPLRGDPAFRSATVMEIVEPFDGNAFRAAYTVQFAGVVYVLDAFQKKSTKGISTPKADIDRIKRRLKTAKEHFQTNYGTRGE
jgi:phage-related protein